MFKIKRSENKMVLMWCLVILVIADNLCDYSNRTYKQTNRPKISTSTEEKIDLDMNE